MEQCIFCRIARGEVPSNKVQEEEDFLAFKDLDPQAPLHLLIIPKKHLSTLLEAQEEDEALLGRMFLFAKELAQREGVAERGFRLVLNCNPAGGQAVFHIHLHLLGGRQMHWPPG